jgi:hypothetical protein
VERYRLTNSVPVMFRFTTRGRISNSQQTQFSPAALRRCFSFKKLYKLFVCLEKHMYMRFFCQESRSGSCHTLAKGELRPCVSTRSPTEKAFVCLEITSQGLSGSGVILIKIGNYKVVNARCYVSRISI